MTQTDEEFAAEVEVALKGCGVDPYAWCDVQAAARFMAEDQHTNAPDCFWTVVRRFKRKEN